MARITTSIRSRSRRRSGGSAFPDGRRLPCRKEEDEQSGDPEPATRAGPGLRLADRHRDGRPVAPGTCNTCTSFAIAADNRSALADRASAGSDQCLCRIHAHLSRSRWECRGRNGLPNRHRHLGDAESRQGAWLRQTSGRRLSIFRTVVPDDRCDSSSARLCCRAGRAHRQESDRPRGPIVADMYFWADFFDYSTARGPAYVPDTAREGPYLHAVCVVGFNELGWIVKNSFGPAWGDGLGFAIIPYGLCALLGAPPPPGGFPRQAFAIDLDVSVPPTH